MTHRLLVPVILYAYQLNSVLTAMMDPLLNTEPTRGSLVMKYPDGNEVRVGDRVQLWNGCNGIVVCSMGTNEYPEAFPEVAWSYLNTGVMVLTEENGLIHYNAADEDFNLIARKAWG